MAARRTVRRVSQEEKIKRRAQQLHDGGMPFQMAMAVARGRLDLSEALERMARRERTEQLMREHGLSKALATQIALGQLSLEAVLRRRRLQEHRTTHRHRTWLEEGRELVLGLHGRTRIEGALIDVQPYTVTVRTGEGEREIHKLHIHYVHEPSAWKVVRKGFKVDKKVAAEELQPIPLPQERYGCSDKRLFTYLDTGAEVTVCLLSGELFKGKVLWFSRYEFTIQTRKGAEVGIFRHALNRVTA